MEIQALLERRRMGRRYTGEPAAGRRSSGSSPGAGMTSRATQRRGSLDEVVYGERWGATAAAASSSTTSG